jgi:hypothetical protein
LEKVWKSFAALFGAIDKKEIFEHGIWPSGRSKDFQIFLAPRS